MEEERSQQGQSQSELHNLLSALFTGENERKEPVHQQEAVRNGDSNSEADLMDMIHEEDVDDVIDDISREEIDAFMKELLLTVYNVWQITKTHEDDLRHIFEALKKLVAESEKSEVVENISKRDSGVKLLLFIATLSSVIAMVGILYIVWVILGS